MKIHTVYVCEQCAFESRSFEEMEEHESIHLGLTVREMRSYMSKKSFVTWAEQYAKDLGQNSNDPKYTRIRQVHMTAIAALQKFEKVHGLAVTEHKSI